jgi:hypothetical protein
MLNILLGQLPAGTGFTIGQIAVAAYAGILWRASGMGWYAVGYFLLGGYRVVRALIVARTRPLVESRQVGLAYAWTETVGSISIILAPVLAGALYESDPGLMFPAAIVLIGATLVLDRAYRFRFPVRIQRPELIGTNPVMK